MKKVIATCCLAISACAHDVKADNMVTLKSGVKLQRISPNKSFNDTREKTVDGVTYFYHVIKTGGQGVFDSADYDVLIGLAFEKVEVQDGKENITIPETIDGIPVVRVGGFKGYSRIKSVSLPKSVISISGGAFAGCSSLESITVPQKLVEIESEAFKGCRKLKTKFVFNNDINVGWEVFCGCHEITSVRFNKGINNRRCDGLSKYGFSQIMPGTFADCRKLRDFVLPPNTYKIGDSTSGTHGAFSNCCSLAKIALPKCLEELGVCAFAECVSLTEVEIPFRIERMGSGVFSGCTALKSVKLPRTLEKLPSNMFAGCTSLETIHLPNAVTELETEVFKGCVKLKSIIIPDHVAELGVSCFEGCTLLQTIKLPLHLDNVKPRAFKDCSSLENLQLPPNVTTIDSQAFEGCNKLASINIPNSVGSTGKQGCGSIGNHAFRGCDSLKSLRLNDGCHCFPDSLAGMVGLEEVDIPASLDAGQSESPHADPREDPRDCHLNIRSYFKDSVNLVRVNVRNMINPKCPGTLKTIGGFKGLKKLKIVKLPEGLQEIDFSAFEDCISLSGISLPNTVKNIRSSAFAGCLSLKNINLPEGVTIDSGAFKGCPAYTDPREEAERQARAAAEVAAREKAAKEAAERHAREQERKDRERREKAEQEKCAREQEEYVRKQEEYERKRKDDERKRELYLQELGEKIRKISEDSTRKTRDSSSGLGTLLKWLVLLACGICAGIFIHSKRRHCSFLESASVFRAVAERLLRKVKAVFPRKQEKHEEPSNENGLNMQTEKNSVKFACPHCGQILEANCEMVGVTYDCPSCGQPFIVSEI